MFHPIFGGLAKAKWKVKVMGTSNKQQIKHENGDDEKRKQTFQNDENIE